MRGIYGNCGCVAFMRIIDSCGFRIVDVHLDCFEPLEIFIKFSLGYFTFDVQESSWKELWIEYYKCDMC